MIAKIPPDHEITALVENFIDHERWCKEHLTIRDKAGMEVPLQLSPSQLKIHALAQRQEARGIPFRAVVLKARQIHMSVGVASLIFRKIAFMEGQRAVTVAHQTDASSQIWGYYQQFYESYQPRSAQDLEILRLTRSHKDQLLEFEGGGYVKVYTAGNRKIGRASSLRFLHLSEYGFWVDAPQVMTGLLQSVPDDPGTMAIIESTANGVGGPFWEVSQMAQSADPGDWCFLFFAWHEHPEYVREPTSQKVFQDSLTGEELDLRRQHQLSLRQLCWRRWCIKNKCEGKIDRFRQEYPSTPEEAFLVSGRTVFSIPKLREMPVIRDPLHGRLERVRHGTKTKLQFLPHEDGELRIWKRPEPGKRYSIGADTAEGLDASDDAGSGDPDYCVAVVGDMETGEQIATWRARINPSTFADHLAALGEWYNWAFLVPEVNSSGLATLYELVRLEYPVHMIYARKRHPDDRRMATTQELGWKTTTVTRPYLISSLDRAILERSIHLRDPIIQQECFTFIINRDGKPTAQGGCHDDCVIATALMVIGIEQAPREARQYTKGDGRPADPGKEYQPYSYRQTAIPHERDDYY